MLDWLRNKNVLVTGAAGSVGVELVQELLKLPIRSLTALDCNESDLFTLGELYREEKRLQIVLGDIRREGSMRTILESQQVVIHAAAFKHVPLCELSPMEAVHTNILGLQHLIDACKEARIERFVFTSSDKAVNPTNVMGVSKLMGERLVTAAHAFSSGEGETVFCSTRFGNVAGSRGSVIPLFLDQIRKGGPITLTDRSMTRFFTTKRRAALLVLESGGLARGGEVFVPRMASLRIFDLAVVMRELLAPLFGHRSKNIEIKEMGSRPGEKMYEELMNEEEVSRTWEVSGVFAILPSYWNLYKNIDFSNIKNSGEPVKSRYHSASEKPLDAEGLKHFLLHSEVLPLELVEEVKTTELPRGLVESQQTGANL